MSPAAAPKQPAKASAPKATTAAPVPRKPVKRRFSPASASGAAATAPTAEHALAQAPPPKPDAPVTRAARQDRTAFTWRLTPEQGLLMDEMVLRLKRQLGTAKLDRAAMLDALMEIASANPSIFAALTKRLQDTLA